MLERSNSASPTNPQAARPPAPNIAAAREGYIAGAIHAQLVGDNSAIALGITATSSSPVLQLCRELVEAGVDPRTPLIAYRGDNTLCLRVRSIGEAAGLEVNGEGTGFRPRRQPDAAPPIAKSGPADAGHHPSFQTISGGRAQ